MVQADLVVGTGGMSVWFSPDRGETWARPYTESGLYLESRVWSLAAHPSAPGQVYAGTDSGIYRWDPAGARWSRVASPMDGRAVWALAQSPHDPRVLIAGTHPAALYGSRDGGATWREVPLPFARECIFVGQPRVTQILFDPRDPSRVWASVEIDGVYRSRDGGEHWQRCPSDGLISEDVHGLAVMYPPGGRRLFATTNKGLHLSLDEGQTWRMTPLPGPTQYTRSFVPSPAGDGVAFVTNGNGPPGSQGILWRSRDFGDTWTDAGLPGETNSTVWTVAAHAADPSLLFACTNLGQLYRSEDGGLTWVKLRRELGEIRALLWQPRADGEDGFSAAFAATLGPSDRRALGRG